MTIGISLLSSEIWTIFYGYNINGTNILMVNIFTGLLINIYMTVSSALQGLNKFKLVYLATISGFATNALLDVPFMLLFYKIGIPSYLGAIAASICGYSLSIIIALISLKKECNLRYGKTIKIISKMLIPLICMIIGVIFLKNIIPVNYLSKISCIIYVGVIGLIGAIIYLFVSHGLGIINSVLGQKMVNNIIKKLTFGKISI